VTGRRLALRLYPRAERAVRRGHPWVFAEGIKQQRHEGRGGDLAVLFDRDDRFLAIGLYDPHSPIRVRVLHRGDPETIDGAWFAARLGAAHQLRRALPEEGTTGFRVVHGENDGLPGLVVDRYGESLVVKLYTVAWFPHLEDVLAGLQELVRPERVVLRLSRAVEQVGAPSGDLRDGQVLLGRSLSGPVLFRENDLTFEADLVRGHKTGFFLDQRDNRRRVQGHCAGMSVLDVFAYTGGFSLYAARGGARSVTSLDVSASALATAERCFRHNASLPGVAAARHRTLVGDAFELLPVLRDRGERFDVVILDPPAFAKAQAQVERAVAGYARILRGGLALLSPGGLLVAASCSSRITAHGFRELLNQTAHRAGLPLRILQQTGHPLDHPIGFPEGAYLKCIYGRIRSGGTG
jgi:23S rRNA (cytosine1962-C5)-methyltransferase